jgi:hypothetical protein
MGGNLINSITETYNRVTNPIGSVFNGIIDTITNTVQPQDNTVINAANNIISNVVIPQIEAQQTVPAAPVPLTFTEAGYTTTWNTGGLSWFEYVNQQATKAGVQAIGFTDLDYSQRSQWSSDKLYYSTQTGEILWPEDISWIKSATETNVKQNFPSLFY